MKYDDRNIPNCIETSNNVDLIVRLDGSDIFPVYIVIHEIKIKNPTPVKAFPNPII